ncbi:MAG: NAD(P)/FAD-dependent oxidoreductase [Promethearchaeota archaeon]
MSEKFDIIIVGAGCAGLAAAIYTGRFGLNTAVFEKQLPGGQINLTDIVENYPGYEQIPGQDLTEIMVKQVEKAGAKVFEFEEVRDLELSQSTKKVITDMGEYEANAVILATGSHYRHLGIPGEKEFTGKGVSYCATCDGQLFKKKKVITVGGGDSAAIYTRYLKDIGVEVRLVHRRNQLRASKTLQEDLERLDIEIIWNTIVTEIFGDEEGVAGAKLKNVETNEESEMKLDGVFIHIGMIPASNLAKKSGIELDERGFIVVNKNNETNIPGVYAAGDITGSEAQLAVVVGEGVNAAIKAYLYIKGGWYRE